MNKLTSMLVESTKTIAAAALLSMMVLVTIDVLLKYLLRKTIPGAEVVVSAYLMIAIVFLSLARVHQTSSMIQVDVVYQYLPQWLKSAIDVFSGIITVVFYGIMVYIFIDVAIRSFYVKEYVASTWNVPVWPARILMPIGLFITCLVVVQMTVSIVTRHRDSHAA